jgi:hypothetical protein
LGFASARNLPTFRHGGCNRTPARIAIRNIETAALQIKGTGCSASIRAFGRIQDEQIFSSFQAVTMGTVRAACDITIAYAVYRCNAALGALFF